jgi:dissimilatory sulfite reductase (desulfoviridin) alpha/beta subunit
MKITPTPLKKIVRGSLRIHHEFRISISDCPNACSRPQITDIGLIGACHPVVKILEIIDRCVEYYKNHCVEGERLGEIMIKNRRENIL